MLKFLVTRFEKPYFSKTSNSLASTEFWRNIVRVDLLEALLLAACFVVIVIPVSSFQLSDSALRGNNRITNSCVIHNNPRKEYRKFYPLLYSVLIRFSFNSKFQNESYSHELASLPTPVHENAGTLAYFSLHPGGDAAALAHLTLYSSHTARCLRATT